MSFKLIHLLGRISDFDNALKEKENPKGENEAINIAYELMGSMEKTVSIENAVKKTSLLF